MRNFRISVECCLLPSMPTTPVSIIRRQYSAGVPTSWNPHLRGRNIVFAALPWYSSASPTANDSQDGCTTFRVNVRSPSNYHVCYHTCDLHTSLGNCSSNWIGLPDNDGQYAYHFFVGYRTEVRCSMGNTQLSPEAIPLWPRSFLRGPAV